MSGALSLVGTELSWSYTTESRARVTVPGSSALRHPPVLDLPAAVGADGVQHAAVVGDEQQGALIGLQGLFELLDDTGGNIVCR